MKKTCICITGPTAVGKTALAIRVAQHFSTSIISADSRQCFQELAIGVARPSPEELAAVPHFFIASHSIHESVNAAVFEQYALKKAADLFSEKDMIIMVGGTGLYIKAFCEGMDEVPEVPAAIRERVMAEYEKGGLAWLQQQVQEKDPGYWATGEVRNPQRLMRVLEVLQATGRSILEYRKGEKKQREFDIIKIGLELPREILYQRINVRVDAMMKNGLLNEAKQLTAFRQLNALQTVGYQELFEYFDGTVSLEEAVAKIKQHTRQYAKRQLTWFKRDTSVHWCAPEWSEVEDLLKAFKI